MVVKKKYKKLTNKEKQFNKEVREELREKGILPPVKPRLNRKKFAQEVWEEWRRDGAEFYLTKALICMSPGGATGSNITPEEIGALKVMKVAMEIKKFEDDQRAKGQSQYSIVDLYDKAVLPVIKL